jgi:hypothetical protein
MRRVEASDHAAPMTETELKGHVLKMAYERGWMVYHVTHSPQRGRQGVGYPDLTLARDGEVLWIELKAQNGALDTPQIRWQFELPSSCYEVIRPSDLARGRLEELLS